MENLALISEKIRNEYESLNSYVIPTEKIALTREGLLSTGDNKFLFTLTGLNQFAEIAEIPKLFFETLEPDLRSLLFNRRFQNRLCDGRIPNKLRINLNKNSQIIGFDDPKLFRINPVKLMDMIMSSLPKSLSAEKVAVPRADIRTNFFQISCFSPDIITEPRPNDIINGGIDIIHHVSGNAGTQISCYLRRLICRNGAVAHICDDDKQLRVRRLNNGAFDESDMLKQIEDRLTEAWMQINGKLEAVKALTEKKRIPLEFLKQERTRLSLNNRILDAIRNAIDQDEIGPTNTAYDIFNSISRIATHHQNLTLRQQRTLSRLAGEFSQQDIHKCDKCGSWLTTLN